MLASETSLDTGVADSRQGDCNATTTTHKKGHRPKPTPNTYEIILLATSKGRKAINPPASGSSVPVGPGGAQPGLRTSWSSRAPRQPARSLAAPTDRAM